MDLASAVVASIGLLFQFLQESKNRSNIAEAKNLTSYLEWLRRKDHKAIADLIEYNSRLSEGISKVLHSDHERIFREMAEIDQKVSIVLMHMESWRDIAQHLQRPPTLSDGARLLLCEVVERGAGGFQAMYHDIGKFTFIIFEDGEIRTDDCQHIEEDILMLQKVGYILKVRSGEGWARYSVTRLGTECARNH